MVAPPSDLSSLTWTDSMLQKCRTKGVEDVIKRKLLIDGDGTGDDRRLNVLLKFFLGWATCESDTPEESALKHDRMLSQISQCEYAVTKSRLSAIMSTSELENYENLSGQIKNSIGEAKTDIESTKIEFRRAKTVRKNRIEYDVLAKVINEQPDRKDTGEKLAQLRADLEAVEETRARLEKKLDMRRKQFHVLLTAIHSLQGVLDDSESEEMMDVSLDTFDGDEEKENGDEIDISEEPEVSLENSA